MAWFRVGIFWKLFLSILVSMACSFVIITFLYLELTPTTSLRPHIKNTILQESYRIAHRIEEDLAAGEESVSAIITRLHQQDSAGIALYAADGRLIARASEPGLDVPVRIPADVVEKAVQQG